MTQASNNEVDLLLRALAKGKRGAVGPDNVPGGTTSNHLDADELNSYAEGVVPEAARGRYTRHLADCDQCRSIMVTLSQAAGTLAQPSVEKTQTGTSFLASLKAFFSPAVLRYAIPALVVTAVIAISLIALRQPQEPALVAKNDAVAPVSKSGEAVQPQPQSSPAVAQAPTAATNELKDPRSNYSSNEKKPVTESEVPKERTAVDELAKREVKDLPASKAAGTDLRPTYAPEPNAAPPPAPVITTPKETGTGTVAEVQSDRANTARDEDKLWNQPKDDTSGPSRSRSQTVGRGAGLATSAPQKTGEVFKQKSAGDVETRSVAGKQFRREGKTWVDTAYGAPRAITNVARNSDQFRALVADEPGLRTYAEQLAGDVIVVWKGKTYRFR